MAITASNNLRRGSKGDDVLALQQKLNTLGYGLAEDGSYGPATEAAVRDYQTKNGLKVDGITGTNTWGSLNNPTTGSTPEPVTPAEPTALQKLESSRPVYEKSDTVRLAEQTLAQREQNKPGAFQSTYQDQINGLLDQIMNREKFSYDFASDPMYQQYKQQYMQGGKHAMMDTTAQAAALSGGFGNSYGATAGNLAYQQYLQGLNDVIPDLYNAALSKYQMEGQDQLSQLSLLQGLEDSAYGKHRDAVSDYYTDLNYQYGKTQDLTNQDYNKYLDALGNWQSDRAYEYGKEQDALSQENWQKEFDFALQKYQDSLYGTGGSSGSSGGGSGSGGSSSKASKSVNSSILDMAAALYDAGEVSKMQDYLTMRVVEGSLTTAQAKSIATKAKESSVSEEAKKKAQQYIADYN